MEENNRVEYDLSSKDKPKTDQLKGIESNNHTYSLSESNLYNRPGQNTENANLEIEILKITKFLERQPKKDNVVCPLCSDSENLKTPSNIHDLFKLYSAYVFCLVGHCKSVSYEKKMLETFFNLEIFLLAQIALPPQDFFHAYKKIETNQKREELVALGQSFKVDNAIHINREEEIESLTYKFSRISSTNFLDFTDDEITLISLILHKRNEPFRFLNVYNVRKMLINNRIAVLFSLADDTIPCSDLISEGQSSSLEYQDILKFKLQNFSIADSLPMPLDFFDEMRIKLGLHRVSKKTKEITYEKELKNFDGIVVTKKSNLNTREFKRWYRSQKHIQKWKECVAMWISNREVKGNAVDLSMMDICAQYSEFEKGHRIFQKLGPDSTIEEKHDRFVKYCSLCIRALKEGNKNFISKISQKKHAEDFENLLSQTSSLEKDTFTSQITEKQLKTLSDIKNTINIKKMNKMALETETTRDSNTFREQELDATTKLSTADVKEASNPKDFVGPDGKEQQSIFEFKSNTCLILKDASVQESTVIANDETVPSSEKKKSISVSSEDYDPAFIEVWTVRLVFLIKEMKNFPKRSVAHDEIIYLICTQIFDNILYFERNSRKEILESILCNICINDQIVQLILKGFYCYCVSCKESNLNGIADADTIYEFCQKVYLTWKNKKSSSLNFFKRKDTATKQEIYCCMLGVCCETEKRNEFISVCKDLKSSSTDLNGEILQIFQRFHQSKNCDCNFFKRNSSDIKNKNNLIKHLFRND